MTTHLPQVIHTYQNHTLDSTRWQGYQPRTGDIVIATAYRSGTTWTQEILRRLIFWHQEDSSWRQVPLNKLSPWLDARWAPLESVIDLLEGQQHRRFIKTHLALDGLPYYPEVKYIVLGRDARDVFMSFINHYGGLTDEARTSANEAPNRVGDPMPPCPEDVHELWHNWITRGWFPWESEGYPYWGNMSHTQSWWNYRHLSNILFVHYNDLLDDLPGELRRLAGFLNIPMTAEMTDALLPDLTLESLRSAAESHGSNSSFKGGAKTFFFKGTNGRWRDVLSAEELALYEEKAIQVLTSDCQAWLEQGRRAFPHD